MGTAVKARMGWHEGIVLCYLVVLGEHVMEHREDRKHTNIPTECEQLLIKELAEIADNEYYMSALDPEAFSEELSEPERRRGRALRGHKRILETVTKFRELQSRLKCKTCLLELSEQLQLQTQGLSEIERAWNIERE